MNKFSCAKEIYKIVIIRWSNADRNTILPRQTWNEYQEGMASEAASEGYLQLVKGYYSMGVSPPPG